MTSPRRPGCCTYVSRTAGPASSPRTARPCSSAAGPPRPTRAPDAGSAWRWSASSSPSRWRGHDRREPARRRSVRRQDRLMTIRVLIVEDEAIAAAGPQDVRRADARVRGRGGRRVVPGGRPGARQPTGRPGAAGHAPARRARPRPAAPAPRDRPPVRRHRGDLGPRRRRRTPVGVAGRRRLSAQAVHVRDVRGQAAPVRRRSGARSRPATSRSTNAASTRCSARCGRHRRTSGCPRASARRPSRPYARHCRGRQRAHGRRGRRGDRLVTGDREALPRAPGRPRAVHARHPLWRHRPAPRRSIRAVRA